MQNPDIAALFKTHATDDGEPVGKPILSKRVRLVDDTWGERFCLVDTSGAADCTEVHGDREPGEFLGS
jgi:hypothetical protein